MGIDPKRSHIPRRIADVFEPHEGHVLNKSEISIQEFSQFRQTANCFRVQHDPDFNSLLPPCKLVQPHDRLVKSVFRLHDIVMIVSQIGIQRYTKAEIRMTYRCKLLPELRPCDPPSVG